MRPSFPSLLVCAGALSVAAGCDDASSGSGVTASATATSTASAAPTATATASAAATVAPRGKPVAPDAVAALVLGGDHSFALYGDGTVKAWGDNSDSALGFGKKAQRQVRPKKVPLLKYVRQIATGEHHTCAVYADGLARCWGRSFGGALGDGSGRDNALPTAVADIRGVVEVRVAGKHSCAKAAKGKIHCWGRIVKDTKLKPVEIAALKDVASVALGNDRACARHGDGKLSCWGLAIGQKYDPKDAKDGGDGNLWASPRPVGKLANVAEIALSRTHACVRHEDGTVSCWGFGSRGQLGDGKMGAGHHLLEPTRVAGLDKVAELALGTASPAHGSPTARCAAGATTPGGSWAWAASAARPSLRRSLGSRGSAPWRRARVTCVRSARTTGSGAGARTSTARSETAWPVFRRPGPSPPRSSWVASASRCRASSRGRGRRQRGRVARPLHRAGSPPGRP
ncbi:MAG: hypothetical protein JRI23_06990 [Deltaproteobacteria bacterium]|nr:hypothetical protein [Deltaproteobacteria bacterium]MBW2531333.1 hypothetical protein [Deltaproteobacteria bacterium]